MAEEQQPMLQLSSVDHLPERNRNNDCMNIAMELSHIKLLNGLIGSVSPINLKPLTRAVMVTSGMQEDWCVLRVMYRGQLRQPHMNVNIIARGLCCQCPAPPPPPRNNFSGYGTPTHTKSDQMYWITSDL